MTVKQAKADEKAKNVEYLLEVLKPGTEISTNIKHVSSSGMSRTIQTLIVTEGRIRDISFLVAKVLDWKFDDNRGGVKVSGCGMDMGFHLVYTLSRIVFKGIEQPNHPHANDCGYWLNQRWL